MKKFLVLILLFSVVSCNSKPEWNKVNSVSWDKSLAFTECKKNKLTGTPGCSVSINDYSSSVHTHVIETDKQMINAGEFLTISKYKENKEDNAAIIRKYKIVQIQKKGNRCRLMINTIKYEDTYLVVDSCTANT